ncbi:MAG: proton-conducting transporter membrane subunit [Candidatus Verstraetearchaeota archaeon]|nr:proton-conducting transporter membrane subunit [Candidatus Verstraetearchaeota archaeon]
MNVLFFQAPILAMLLALMGSFGCIIVGLFSGRRAVEWFTGILTAVSLVLSALAVVNVFFLDEPYVYMMGGWPPPVGIPYVIDRYSAPLALVVSAIFFATMVYSVRYIERDRDVKWYYSLRFLMQAGMYGLLFSGDMFHIFVMLELMGLSAILLVPFRKEVKASVEAGIKYGIYDILAISIYYLCTAMIFGMFGTMTVAEIAAKLGGYVSPFSGGIFANTAALPVIIALIVWSFTIGSAVVPQHFWLPDAHSMAPSSISAILSGLLVQVNIAVLARILFDGFAAGSYPGNEIGLHALLILGAISSVIGAAFMLVQSDIKRLIAYSTIANLGLIAMGFGLGTIQGASASYLHIINHAFVKAALFMIAGVFIHATGSREISSLKGISKVLPGTSLLYTIGTLAAIGFPPLSMFWSKLLLLFSVLSAGGSYQYVVVPMALTIVLESIAQIRLLAVIYSGEKRSVNCRPSYPVIASVGMMIGIIVITGLMPSLLFELGGLAASDLLNIDSYIDLVLKSLNYPP